MQSKYSLLILLFLSFFITSNSQENKPKRKTHINFHIGPSFSNYTAAKAPNIYITHPKNENDLTPSQIPINNYQTNLFKDLRTNLTAGLSLEYYFKNDISVLFGINYEGKGIDLKHSDSNIFYNEEEKQVLVKQAFEVNHKTQYITIPLIGRKYLFSKQVFYIQGGIYLAYLLSSDINTYNATFRTTENDPNQYYIEEPRQANINIFINDNKESTTKFDFGTTLGCGLKLPLGNGIYFTSDLLINIGLRKIDSINKEEFEEVLLPASTGYYNVIKPNNYFGLNSKAKNLNTTLTLGISIDI